MKNKYKKIGDYKVREIPNLKGKSIEETLQDIFLIYCTDKIQEQMLH